MAFKPGDVVLLRSGGPPMTVVAVDEDEIKCVWIGEEGELFRESLPPIALDLVETDLDEDDEDGDDEDGDDGDLEEDDEGVGGDDGADDVGADREAEGSPPRRVGRS